MKKIVDLDILVRCHNEEEWIIRCLEGIEKQKVSPKNVHVIDNESTDSSMKRIRLFKKNSTLSILDSLYINTCSSYFPGKCLNKYIEKVNSKYTVFLSAHCIPANQNWLSELFSCIENDPKVAAAYGRQIPTSKSDARDARDLLWTFGKEERMNKEDIFFHNANSIARTSLLKKYPFNEQLTNIEDRVWANKILSLKKFLIKYNPLSVVFHEHGIHQTGEIQRANQIISIAKQVTDREEFVLPKSNIGCFIPYKTSNNFNSDCRKIKKTLKIAKELGFRSQNIICSVEGDIKVVELLDDPSVFLRKLNKKEINLKRGLKEILLSMNSNCEDNENFFDEILLLEPNYTSRKIKTIKNLITKFNSSPHNVAMIKFPLKPHIWKVSRYKTIRIDNHELNREEHEEFTLAMRGLGMIFKVSQLRKENWLDENIEFIESKDIIECIPEV